jgi:hypothetical protein
MSNKSTNIFQSILGFSEWGMAIKRSSRSKKHPTGYAILKQKSRDDCMIVNLDRKGNINYLAMIWVAIAYLVLENYCSLYVHFKKRKFTISGKLKTGKHRTLGMAIIHNFAGDKIDPSLDPHHPDCDPTNDLYLIALDDVTHEFLHRLIIKDTPPEVKADIVRQLGNAELIQYYSSPESWEKFGHKTHPMCEKIHEKDFFGKMPLDAYYALIDAIRNEFYK